MLLTFEVLSCCVNPNNQKKVLSNSQYHIQLHVVDARMDCFPINRDIFFLLKSEPLHVFVF